MSKPIVISRQITINAPMERVHALVADLREWRQWSPWEDLDPAMERTYSTPASGVGASYGWSGNKKAGKGQMTITTDRPNLVALQLRYEKPFPADNKVEFQLTPVGAATQVVWQVTAPTNFIMRMFNVVKMLDKMMGSDFEKGLARLKSVAESDVPAP